MKKSILLIFSLIIVLSVPAFGADRVDMIVLLDNSVSVLPIYDRIQESLLRRIISEHLAPGDTFSLITFSDYPEVEISREIKNEEDVNGILAYSALLQPMGSHTDLILALRFLYKYALDLPLSNKKKIVILTDGIHDPPDDSPYLYSSGDEARAQIKAAADEIHREGWDVSIVEIRPDDEAAGVAGGISGAMPGATGADSSAAGSGDDKKADKTDNSVKVNAIDTVSESLGSKPNVFDSSEDDMAGIVLGIPLVSIPDHIGTVSGDFKVPLNVENRSNEMMLFSLSAVISDQHDMLKKKASVKLDAGESGTVNIELKLPEGIEAGEQSSEVALKLVGGIETQPRVLVLNYNFQPRAGISRAVDYLTDWRVIAVIIAIIAAILIIIIIQRISAGKGEVRHPASGLRTRDEKDTAKQELKEASEEPMAASGENVVPVLKIKHEPEEMVIETGGSSTDDVEHIRKNRPVQMHVYGQNTKLGISNVQWLGLNRKRSVGGASSAVFRIFFLKVPAVIANIECTGDDFIFHPAKPEYFPELDGPMHECLNKRIRIITDEKKLFYIEFRQWISELERLNRLMTMTRKPGKPDMDF